MPYLSKSIRILGLSLMMLLIYACPKPEDDGTDSDVVIQEPVDWPSLANSSWPMYDGGPLGNGMSFETGPTLGEIVWYVDTYTVGDGIVIDFDGNVLSAGKGDLISISQDGVVNWELTLADNYSKTTPVIFADSSIGVFCFERYFLVSPQGTILSEKTLPAEVDMLSPRIDKDGTIYLVLREENLLRAYSKEGDLLWTVSPPDSLELTFIGSIYLPVFSVDGNGLYLVGSSTKNLYYVLTSGAIDWIKSTNSINSPPVVDTYGNLYYYSRTDSVVTRVDKTGDDIWRTYVGDFKVSSKSRPTVTVNGKIIFPSEGNKLMCLSPAGNILWQIDLPIWGIGGLGITSELVSDMNETIYVHRYGQGYFAVSGEGDILWEVPGTYYIGQAPALAGSKLYFGSEGESGGIYAIK